MTKELKYLDKQIKNLEYRLTHPIKYYITDTTKVVFHEDALYEEELKTLKNIRQSLKAKSKKEQALEIIVAKKVNLYGLKGIIWFSTYTSYKEWFGTLKYSKKYRLTEEEFSLLKEMLKNE